MSGNSFRSVFMVASCAGAALSCYLVSLRVASERAALEDVETRIVLAQRDIRLLQTEIGTRGRLAQLERWNVKVLALSAPSADQFLDGGFALARLARPEPKLEITAPVVLASAPADAAKPRIEGLEPAPQAAQPAPSLAPRDMMHVASLRRDVRPAEAVSATPKPAPLRLAAPKPPEAKAKVAAAKPAPDKKAKATVKVAASDPLAPLPSAKPKPTKLASNTPKDSARKQ
ncbi:hypothetical protein [Sphingomonas sp.]|uniref:hypothetical protein n=1 Tax=Sphingomonas sp. TaxID=28214 RepID=UPI00286DB23C|nr:hypothetical protein [Sphingomonas sp.]